MADSILDFASLNNILGFAYGKPETPTPEPVVPAPMPESQPMFPMPGIGAPTTAQALYGSFDAEQPTQRASRPEVQVPRLIPTEATIAMVPRNLPLGNSNAQVDMLRLALRTVESGGNYQAKNKTTSASGAYQNTHDNWGGYGGYAEARYAPPHVQDAKANEDVIRSLKQFNGDPFAVIANHMLPIQARKPWMWTQPSYLKVKGKLQRIPPVIDYVRKVVKGTPYENELNTYMANYLPRAR